MTLERAVLEHALAGDHPVLRTLREQLEVCTLAPRTETGVGFYVELECPSDMPTISGMAAIHISDVIAEIDGLKHGAGFVIHVRNGRLDQVEGFSYDEPWPKSIGFFRLSYAGGETREQMLSEIARSRSPEAQ